MRVLRSLAPSRDKPALLQLVVFAAVGGALNVVYAGLYVALRPVMDAQWANAISLVLSTILGTWAHRRVTFGVQGVEGTVPHQSLGLGLLGFSLVLTAGSLWLLEASVDEPSRTAEVVVLVAANLGVGLVRFLAFRTAMLPYRADRRRDARDAGPAG